MELCRCERLDESQFVRFRQLVENEEEVDVNCTDEYKRTPLISLCRHNRSDGLFDCVRLLLHRHDIQINQTTGDGANALMLMCGESKSDQILEVAQLLIDKGININQTDDDGRNAVDLLTKNRWLSKSKKKKFLALLPKMFRRNIKHRRI